MTKALHFTLLFAAILAGCESSDSKLVTACALGSEPIRYQSTLVRVSGEMFSDGMHSISLFDRACPNESIKVDFNERSEPRSAVDRLNKIFFGGVGHGTDVIVNATLVGVFLSQSDRLPRDSLVVQQISNLDVRRRKL